MVLYQNINVGQRVEVKLGNLVFRGVVKYKGSVINRQGDWVGVALERASTLHIAMPNFVVFGNLRLST